MLGFSAVEAWHMTPRQISDLYVEYAEFYGAGGIKNG